MLFKAKRRTLLKNLFKKKFVSLIVRHKERVYFDLMYAFNVFSVCLVSQEKQNNTLLYALLST